MRPKKKRYSPVLISAGALLVIIFAYYCAGGMREGETIFEWQKRMELIMRQPTVPYLNGYTVRTIIVFLLAYAMAVIMYITSRRNYMPGREMGSAQYADVKKVNQKLSDLSTDPDDPYNIAVPAHRWRWRK